MAYRESVYNENEALKTEKAHLEAKVERLEERLRDGSKLYKAWKWVRGIDPAVWIMVGVGAFIITLVVWSAMGGCLCKIIKPHK